MKGLWPLPIPSPYALLGRVRSTFACWWCVQICSLFWDRVSICRVGWPLHFSLSLKHWEDRHDFVHSDAQATTLKTLKACRTTCPSNRKMCRYERTLRRKFIEGFFLNCFLKYPSFSLNINHSLVSCADVSWPPTVCQALTRPCIK